MAFWEGFWGTIAFTTTIIGLAPQVYKSFRTKSTTDVSFLMLLNYLVCSVTWVIYGIYNGSSYVVWSNVFGILMACISIWQKQKYDGG
ncbi:MAG: hypothetical protein LBF65_01605 [Holosporales bacterium]|jgi:MtN3 and saliva related transmembrane protein|nr:hypothetical protein [Holosporales bacterium]